MNYNIKRSIDGFVRLLPAGLVMWGLYDLLMLAIGGRNAAYGTGLLQWNYVRWILASRDTWVFSPSFQIFWSFFYLPVLFGALSGSLIFSLRTRYGGERLSRRLWAYALIVDLSLQCSALSWPIRLLASISGGPRRRRTSLYPLSGSSRSQGSFSGSLLRISCTGLPCS